MRRLKTTVILLVVAGLLTLWWGIVELPKIWEGLYPGRQFVHLLRDDIKRIEIKKPDQTIILERGADGWTIEAPVNYPAGTGPVDTLVSALVFLESKRVFEKEVEGAFPESGPRFTVTFTAQGEQYVVDVGKRDLTEPLEYYRVGSRVFLGEEELKLCCERPVDAWRDKAVSPVNPDRAGRLVVEGETGSMILNRSKEGVWFFAEPFTTRASAAEVSALIDGVNTLAVLEFLCDDGTAPLAEYGLDKPRWTVEVTSIVDGKVHEILIGKTVPGGAAGSATTAGQPGEIYVKRADRVQVFRCEDTVTRHLKRPPEDFRDRRVLPFGDHGWVKSVAVRGFSQDFSLTRAKEEDDWAGVSREVGAATFSSPRKRGATLVDETGNLQITRFCPEETIGAEQFRLSLHVDGLKEPMTLIFGRTVEDDPDRYLARRQNVPGEPDVPFELYTSLPRRIGQAGSLYYRSMVQAIIDPDRLLYFSLLTPKGVWRLVHLGDWRLDEQPALGVDQMKVGKAVAFLCRPSAAFYELEKTSLEDMGVSRGRYTALVQLPGVEHGKFPYRHFYIGQRIHKDRPFCYARLDTKPTVFILDPTPLLELTEHLAEIAEHVRDFRPGPDPLPPSRDDLAVGVLLALLGFCLGLGHQPASCLFINPDNPSVPLALRLLRLLLTSDTFELFQLAQSLG